LLTNVSFNSQTATKDEKTLGAKEVMSGDAGTTHDLTADVKSLKYRKAEAMACLLASHLSGESANRYNHMEPMQCKITYDMWKI
jgi:hypothetical protein